MSTYMDEEKVKTHLSYTQLVKLIWPFCKGARAFLSLTIVSSILVSVTGRLSPWIFGQAIDRGFTEKNLSALQFFAGALLANEILHALFNYFYVIWFNKFGNRTLFNLREALIQHTQSLPLSFFHKNPSGRIITRITNDVSTLGEVFTDGVISLALKILTMISIVVAMFMISWKLALIVLIPSPLFVWMCYRISEQTREILRESKKRLSLLSSFLAENLNGIKVIYLYNRVTRNRERFKHLSANYRDQILISNSKQASLQPIMNLFNAVTIAMALYWCGLFNQESGLAIGSVVAFLMHVQDFIPPLRDILEKYQQFQNSLTSAERVFHLLEEKPEENTLAVKSSESGPGLKSIKGALSAKHLNFQYEPNLPWVLKDVNFSIDSGQRIALVGRTGSGKSTLVSLIQRFYEPPTQQLFIDAKPIEEFPRLWLRRRIGVVQQDSFIFRGSLKENIGLSDPDISLSQIEEACRRIGYLDFLKRSGRDLNFMIEEKGANLSTGERQLIAFARILVFSPDILILDEATANIDSETEVLIQKATEEITQNRTSLIIAHRLSTIAHCDQIFVFSEGQIVERGTHQELLQKQGYYHRIATAGELPT